MKAVNPKGNQPWTFTGRADTKTEAPIFWPPDAKNHLIGKDPDAGNDLRQKKRVTEDETVGWHHPLSGHEFEQALGGGEGWGNLVCCHSRGHRVRHDWGTKQQQCCAGRLLLFVHHLLWKTSLPGFLWSTADTMATYCPCAYSACTPARLPVMYLRITKPACPDWNGFSLFSLLLVTFWEEKNMYLLFYPYFLSVKHFLVFFHISLLESFVENSHCFKKSKINSLRLKGKYERKSFSVVYLSYP